MKAADVDLCTGSSNLKEISSSAEVEAVEEAGNSPSPFSASEEEGVSRCAEVSWVLYNYDDHLTTCRPIAAIQLTNTYLGFTLSSPSLSLQQTNSDAYLADASSLMSSDDSDSKLDGADFVDFDLPWRKKKSLLERIRDEEELTPPVSAADCNEYKAACKYSQQNKGH